MSCPRTLAQSVLGKNQTWLVEQEEQFGTEVYLYAEYGGKIKRLRCLGLDHGMEMFNRTMLTLLKLSESPWAGYGRHGVNQPEIMLCAGAA